VRDLRQLHRAGQLCLEPGVARQAQDVRYAVRLAPPHHLLAAEAGIGSHQDLDLRPRLADLPDDPLELVCGPVGAVGIGAAQAGDEQVLAAEDIEREVAVVAVVAVEEAAFLMTVDGVVGRVEIEDDLLGRVGVRLQEQLDEEPLDRRLVMRDLVIARRLRPAQLKPVRSTYAPVNSVTLG
jgi:hypothetical protein